MANSVSLPVFSWIGLFRARARARLRRVCEPRLERLATEIRDERVDNRVKVLAIEHFYLQVFVGLHVRGELNATNLDAGRARTNACEGGVNA